VTVSRGGAPNEGPGTANANRRTGEPQQAYHPLMSESRVLSPLRSVGIADVEAEHALQFKLLGEAERLLESDDRTAAREVIEQLHSYSDAHFASEQVLMRLHSYPGYAAHEREHGELLAALQELLANLDADDLSRAAAFLRRWLTSHIHHADQSFLEFMNPPEHRPGG
jgi:hemerythrin